MVCFTKEVILFMKRSRRGFQSRSADTLRLECIIGNMTSMSQQELAASQSIFASFRPLFLLAKVAKLDAHFADLVLVDGIRHLLGRAARNLRGCSFHMFSKLAQAVQECDHTTIETAVEKTKAQWYISRRIQLKE